MGSIFLGNRNDLSLDCGHYVVRVGVVMHPYVIAAASSPEDDGMLGSVSAAARARRVIRALAQPEAIPDEAVKLALRKFWDTRGDYTEWPAMRAAFSAALLHMARRGSDMRSQLLILVVLCQLTGAFAGVGAMRIDDGQYTIGLIWLALGFLVCIIAAVVHAGIDERLQERESRQ